MTNSQLLQLGASHHQAGRLADAEHAYQQVLASEPNQPDAMHLLGVLAGQVGKLDIAAELIGRAIRMQPMIAEYHSNVASVYRRMGQLERSEQSLRTALRLRPDLADAYNNLGITLRDMGKLDDAIAAYHRASELKPQSAEAANNLGNALQEKGDFAGAIGAYQRAIALKPTQVQTWYNLGLSLHQAGRNDEAIPAFERAISLKPDYAEAHNDLGVALADLGKWPEAASAYDTAVKIKADFADAYNNLGNALSKLGQMDPAVTYLNRAIQLKPDLAEAYGNLGNVLLDQGKFDAALASFRQAICRKPAKAENYFNLGTALSRAMKLDEAVAAFGKALELKDDFHDAYINLGNVYKDQGRLDDAANCYRRALALRPDSAGAESNLVYTMYFRPDCDPAQILQAHRQWANHHEQPLIALRRPHANDRSPNRRLKIGYVSPDFRHHVVGWNLLPILEHHDHENFEFFCYGDVRIADDVTLRFRENADQWRETWGTSDARLADLIRADGIDILVDLTLHMKGNRLLVFARKPAPIQLTYLGYCAGTGLEAIDYRFSDRFLDPVEMDKFYVEKTLRLPHSYWCYRPGGKTPPISPPPDKPVFICLNNFAKVSDATLLAWREILRQSPDSEFIIHSHPGNHRQRVTDHLGDKVRFVEGQGWESYMASYGQAAVSLDPFPYCGGITTCDSLWMGVPVVTLAGQTAVARGGRTILSQIGLQDLVANTTDQYIQIAIKLSHDRATLAELRRTLRDRMKASPLMDAPARARDIEAAYRQMWLNQP